MESTGNNNAKPSSSSSDISMTKNISQKKLNDNEVNKNKKKRRSSSLQENPNPKKLSIRKQPNPPHVAISPPKTLLTTPNHDGHKTFGGVPVYIHHSIIDKTRVKQSRRIYNKYFLHLFQVHNAAPADENDVGKPNRADLKAVSKMTECNEILFPEKRVGHLPGIDVGDQFYSRAEMVALGLHLHWLKGIDFMGETYRKMEFKDYTFPIAISIVLSGQYEDGHDNSDEIVYTGEGGNDLNGCKHQFKDQVMQNGNLALKNCKEQSIPVRVIRGHTDDRNIRIYTYDGLYEVSDCWPAEGVSGYIVYKYLLKRLKGQPKLTSNKVQYSNGRSSRILVKTPKLVSLDITEGQEDVHIPATNTIDGATLAGFTYTKYNQVASNLRLPLNAVGCKCQGDCTNSNTCACASLNGSDFPYVRSDGGRLIEPKDVIFECGPNCGCGPGCINRISQRGIKYKLEVFRTSDRGWAVKTNEFIPSGAPVCEYIGELRRTFELNNVAENDYIFEIDCWQTMKGIGGRERRLGDVSESVSNKLEKASDEKDTCDDEHEPEFCIDAGRMGNVARFINHSCEPNLFVQCVLSTHHDLKLARIVLFASDNIPPTKELTYDYGYALNSVVDDHGNVKTLACHCGTSECRKRLY